MSSLKDYSKVALETKLYHESQITPTFSKIIYLCLGLGGECGELYEKVKKAIRDKNCKVDEEFLTLIKKELGDILWYWAAVCDEFGIDPDEVSAMNLEKIKDRLERDVLKGEGDER